MSLFELESPFQKVCFLCHSGRVKVSRKRRALIFQRLHLYFQCEKCKAFSLYPILNSNEVRKLYSDTYIHDVNPDLLADQQAHKNRFSDLHDALIAKKTSENVFFLDYGCGANPESLMLAKSLGYNSFGVEVEEDTRAQAHLISGCQVFSTDEISRCEISFDVIFLGDVLEHLNNPLKVLNLLGSLLNPGGIMIIQGPLEGARTFSNFLIGNKARIHSKVPSSFPPYHVSLATKQSILCALRINGLVLQKLMITEPQWPSPKFGSKKSFTSVSAFIFSFSKVIDIGLSRVLKNFGTRFYAIVEKKANDGLL
jgi:SAM-dependent methyltransferase